MITIEITPVSGCSVQACAYNVKEQCHAKAITIGDSESPSCDTMMQASRHVNSVKQAGVGACKVSSCIHNDELECSADSIKVGMKGQDVKCMTFSAR